MWYWDNWQWYFRYIFLEYFINDVNLGSGTIIFFYWTDVIYVHITQNELVGKLNLRLDFVITFFYIPSSSNIYRWERLEDCFIFFIGYIDLQGHHLAETSFNLQSTLFGFSHKKNKLLLWMFLTELKHSSKHFQWYIGLNDWTWK